MATFRRKEARLKRQKRVRKKIRGTPERPRLCVFRSRRHIYAQLIDDTMGKTLVACSSLSKDLASKLNGKGGNTNAAALVGEHVARLAMGQGINRVVFDRNGFLYHGRVQALSDAARQGGLDF